MNLETTLYDALLGIDIPAERVRAVVDALEHDMISTLASKQDISNLALATKQDIAATKQDIATLAAATRQDIVQVRQEVEHLKQEVVHFKQQAGRDVERLDERITHEIELLRSSMTVRTGSMLVVAMGLLFAALKLT
jgi:hypothetical protein